MGLREEGLNVSAEETLIRYDNLTPSECDYICALPCLSKEYSTLAHPVESAC